MAVCFCAGILYSAIGAHAAEVYVCSTGSDENPGTKARPLATLARARDLVRASGKLGKEPVTVHVAAAVYYLPDTLVFTEADSGTKQAPVLYQGAGDGETVLSGGSKLDFAWCPCKGGIMQAKTPPGLAINQLFVNGKRQIRARYPNGDSASPAKEGYILAAGADSFPHRHVRYDPKTFTKKRWSRPDEGVIHIFQGPAWGNMQWQIKNSDWDNHLMQLGRGGEQMGALWASKESVHYSVIDANSRFFVENIFEELDSPREWYHDRAKGLLFYCTPKDIEPRNALFEASRLKHLIEFKGTKDNPVRHISFSGFRFTHCEPTYLESYDVPSLGDWGIYRGGAIVLEGAEDCCIDKCFFDAVGGNGVFINHHARRITISGNVFSESGDSAVCLAGKSHLNLAKSYKCKHCGADHWWGWDEPKDEYPADCVISDNVIHDIGVFGKQVAGVFLSMCMKNVISHNHIYNVPRAAICLHDGCWGGHIIEFNDVHDTVRETSDHGPFNSWGREPYWCLAQSHGPASHPPAGDVKQYARHTTVVRNNRFRDYHGWGIDLDDGSSNYHVYNNLCIGMSIKLREGAYRTVENNIIVNPAIPFNTHVCYEDNHDRITRNIIVVNSRFDAPEVDVTFQPRRHQGAVLQGVVMPNEGKWADEIDNNVYWSDLGKFVADFSKRNRSHQLYGMDQWRELGYDRHSVYADPMFIDPAKGDFRVRPASPALKVGFQNFPMDQFGVRKTTQPARGDTQELPRKYQAQWIWAKVEAAQPFQFVRFRKTFELGGVAEKATAFVTADTFYRLWINGELAMHGPARSSAGKAAVDAVDVASLLKPGRNVIEAEAMHYDGRFEALGQAPGFLCELDMTAGGARRVVATDGAWEAREVAAWLRNSPKHSFQRTWSEDYDARLEENPAWRPAVVLGPVGTGPWKTVALRDVPLPNPRQTIRPASVVDVQRGDGLLGESKGTPELASTRYGPRPDWCRRLQTERGTADESAAVNPKGVTDGGSGDAILNGEGASIVYDLGANQLGFFGFELSGAAGQSLELVWNESLDPTGKTVRPIQGIEATQAMRYVLRDGRQSFLSFNPFLARYVRVVHRGAGEITVHRLWMSDYSFAVPQRGDFQCSDDGLNRVFAAAARTARLNTLDTFMDNPSRERGAWFREGYWTAQSVYAVFGDLSVSRRMVRQGADSQEAADRKGPPGMVQMLYPATNLDGNFIPAHALFWALQAGLHERIAGDREFVREIIPAVRRLMEAFHAWRNEDGLLENVPSWNFLDWAQIRTDGASVALNAMYARTLDEVARLDESIGETARAARYRDEAAQVRQSLNRLCPGDLFYPDALVRNAEKRLAPSRETCEATQYFVLWAEVPPAERASRMWQALRDDFRPTPGDARAIKGLSRGGLYSFFERLQTAARFGDHEALVRDVKAMFQPMADSSPGTLWEHPQRQWCLCQGFASGVASIMTEEILGIRLERPTRIAPHCGGLQWCKGHVATPRGRVNVAWKLEKDRYELAVSLPTGETAEVVLPPEAEAVWRSGTAIGAWNRTIQVTGHKNILITPGRIQ